jgi:hypothetical protein
MKRIAAGNCKADAEGLPSRQSSGPVDCRVVAVSAAARLLYRGKKIIMKATLEKACGAGKRAFETS